MRVLAAVNWDDVAHILALIFGFIEQMGLTGLIVGAIIALISVGVVLRVMQMRG